MASNTIKYKLAILDLESVQAYAKTALTSQSSSDKNAFKARFSDLRTIRDNFVQAHILIEATKKEESDVITLQSKYSEMQNIYYEIQSYYDQLFPEKLKIAVDNTTAYQNVSLPKLNLIVFSGISTDWMNFKNTFDSLIHSNQSLNAVQKMHYLITSLTGEALICIKHLPISDANYLVAYNLLKARFENIRLMADLHVEIILSSQPVKPHDNLRKFISLLKENLGALEALHFPVQEWSFILLHIVLRKLPKELRIDFEIQHKSEKIPSCDQLLKFLEGQCLANEMASGIVSENTQQRENSNKVSSKAYDFKNRSSNNSNLKSFVSNIAIKCLACNSPHGLHKCDQFLNLSEKDRYLFVKEHNLCLNCLVQGKHNAKNCQSRFSCKNCQARHHTLLHFPKKVVENPEPQENSSEPIAFTTVYNKTNTSVLLSTAYVDILDKNGVFQKARVLLDSASQANFMSENCVKRLGLPRIKKHSLAILGIGNIPTINSNGLIKTLFRPVASKESGVTTDFLILNNICSNMPSSRIVEHEWPHITGIKLGDPKFYIPSEIDILFGSEIFASLLCPGKLIGNQNEPVAIETKLGWVLMGNVKPSNNSINSFFTSMEETIDEKLKCFWEIENIPMLKKIQSPEEIRCEQLYIENTYRNQDGRYVVSFPFKESPEKLGKSYDTALSRLTHLEKRLDRNPDFKSQYISFMREYLSLGHMMEIPSQSPIVGNHFIPHHGIIKETSSTTRLRVVFDASTKTSSGTSLNDILLVGPKLQKDIVELMCNFRIHKIVFTADIRQMYRQILMDKNSASYQHILWRESPSHPVKEYELQTVTYGTSSAPFLAIRTLHQLANDEKLNYPEAASTLIDNTYVDDIINGAHTLEGARHRIMELIALLQKGGFELRKWSSNCPEILEDIPVSYLEVPLSFELDADKKNINILGIKWIPSLDKFTYKINNCFSDHCTKRIILSTIARLYDPLGFINPVVFIAKCFMQNLWKIQIGWDDEIPSEMNLKWKKYIKELPSLANLRIDRYVTTSPKSRCILVGFSDASERGYCGIVYLVVINNKEISSHILLAKSRVAPIKVTSIPRLELLGAVLLANLLTYCKDVYKDKLQIERIIAFTDSTIVLAWLKTPSFLLQTFIANRVEAIIENIPYEHWYHISSQENPADLGSRGVFPNEIAEASLWWYGPNFLSSPLEEWLLVKPQNIPAKQLPEYKSKNIIALVTNVPTRDQEFLLKFSSLSKLLRVISWCRRFINKLCSKSITTFNVLSPLSLKENNLSLTCCIKLVQTIYFQEDIDNIHSHHVCSTQLQKLAPFIDENGVLRVGGRIRYAQVSENARHPIILPKQCHLTTLIIDHYHSMYLHPGPRALQSIISLKYWIISARNVIRHRLSKCIACFKNNPRGSSPMMGNLPASRFREGRPFLNVGTDYGGPFFVRESRRRGAKTYKAYLCLFVCLSTKAVHLELVSDLSTDAYIAALDRFISRRGVCQNIYSDCGTNFIGANRYHTGLSKFIKESESNNRLVDATVARSIVWHFNPPSAPHFNGLSEAGIKSTKHHLKRVVGDQVLTFEELTTVLTRVEAILNSRPIGALSSDPSEMDPLTPAHFLIGAPLVSVLEEDFVDVPMNRLSRWQLLKQMSQQFWNRWRKEYLHTLQQRNKWATPNLNLKVDDLVMIDDSQSAPMRWPVGRVVELFPGADGIVRVVSVRTPQGILKRPVVKLYRLPID